MTDPDRLTASVIGDGGYLFANPSVCHQIAAANDLPVLTVVANNGGWDAVRTSTLRVYPDGAAAKANAMPFTELPAMPDLVATAEAGGAWARRVTDRDELRGALGEAVRGDPRGTAAGDDRCGHRARPRHHDRSSEMSLPASMRHVRIAAFGPAEGLELVTAPVPEPGSGEVLIRVAAAGVNRPDILQRTGKYPPPAGASDIPGLEVSGTVVATGADTTRFDFGDEVCALVASGGYAEYCVAPRTAMPTGA